MLSSKMNLNVAVIRKVNCAANEASPWFPKKVIVMTGNRRIETMAWAHSSDNLLERPGSADIGCQVEGASQNNLSMVS
ncbi:hypothetical protein OESDEN_17567 [Oesophagostomum dentatum]|uniref:Uncharacterized protein n=1 Tax=Oesophagostomum dentatum TaxID=61180 RepID=A0A0B1SBR5_OESDE|nr:hypothetical protein OESDEN_17567 [Oesophagostomum dentatum]